MCYLQKGEERVCEGPLVCVRFGWLEQATRSRESPWKLRSQGERRQRSWAVQTPELSETRPWGKKKIREPAPCCPASSILARTIGSIREENGWVRTLAPTKMEVPDESASHPKEQANLVSCLSMLFLLRKELSQMPAAFPHPATSP